MSALDEALLKAHALTLAGDRWGAVYQCRPTHLTSASIRPELEQARHDVLCASEDLAEAARSVTLAEAALGRLRQRVTLAAAEHGRLQAEAADLQAQLDAALLDELPGGGP